MDRDTAIETLRKHEQELRRRGVRHAALFGSVARGEAHAGSDLDVMIEIDEAEVRTVYDYVGVVNFIEDLFPMKVDVANRGTLKDRIRVRAERDAIAAF
jgi:predicted nucleotidyltransferase